MQRALIAAMLSCSAVPAPAADAAYPARPVRVVVPWPAGGITDVIIRAVGAQLGEATGQQFVIDNRPGAGGTLGAGIVAKAAGDGYTLLVHDVASHCIAASMYRKLPFDTLKDFEPVAMVAGSPMVLVANPSLGVRTLPQLIEAAKAKPGQINYASSGTGAITHLGAVRLQRMTGIDLVHVPFKGSIPAATSVINGETAVSFSTLPAALPQAKAGRLVLVATSFPKRSSQTPDIPTIAETVGEYDLGLYSGMWAPAGTPRAIVERLHAETMKTFEQPRVKDMLATTSSTPGRMTPKEFGAYLAKEVGAWGEIVRGAGLKAD